MRLLLTNVIYSSQKFGHTYGDLYLNYQLKSLLDDTNIPTALLQGHQVEVTLFCDTESEGRIRKHPNMMKLVSMIGPENVALEVFNFRPSVDRFNRRYNVLARTLVPSIKLALDKGAVLGAWVADLVVAKNFLPRTLKKIEEGYDAVFVLPMRSAAEGVADVLNANEGALPDWALFKAAYENIHPLWLTCHYGNQPFTDKPFCLLWNSGSGLLARSYSITPILFKPKPAMLETQKVIDVELPGMCDKPYWCTDWTDAPVIGVEPLASHWPVFDNEKRSGDWIRDWAGRLEPSQHEFLKRDLFYPDQRTAQMSQEDLMSADMVAKLLTRKAGEQ